MKRTGEPVNCEVRAKKFAESCATESARLKTPEIQRQFAEMRQMDDMQELFNFFGPNPRLGEQSSDDEKISLVTNARPLSELKEKLRAEMDEATHSGPGITIGQIRNGQGSIEDAQPIIDPFWFSKTGRTKFSGLIEEAAKKAKMTQEDIMAQETLIYNSQIWPERVASYLYESVGGSMRSCVRGTQCVAYVHLRHTLNGDNGKRVILREFMDSYQESEFREYGQPPARHNECDMCLKYLKHRNDLFAQSCNGVARPSACYNTVGEDGAYDIRATLMPNEQAYSSIHPTRYFCTTDYIPDQIVVNGKIVRGFRERGDVMHVSHLPSDNTFGRSGGMKPFFNYIVESIPCDFTTILIDKLRMYTNSIAQQSLDLEFVLGDLQPFCQALQIILLVAQQKTSETEAQTMLATTRAGKLSIEPSVLIETTVNFLENRAPRLRIWETMKRPQIGTHILTYAVFGRIEVAQDYKQILDEWCDYYREHTGKANARAVQQLNTCVCYLDRFIERHDRMVEKISELADNQQPFDDITLLGASPKFALHEFGLFEPSQHVTPIPTADRIQYSVFRSNTVREPTPKDVLVAHFGTDTVIISVGKYGNICSGIIFTDFWTTVCKLNAKNDGWKSRLLEICDNFKEIVGKPVEWPDTIVLALLLRIHCCEFVLETEKQLTENIKYNLRLFSNSHMDFFRHVHKTPSLPNSQLLAALERLYPFSTAVMHQGLMPAFAPLLNYIGFLAPVIERDREVTNLWLKVVPRCCESRGSQRKSADTCTRHPTSRKWLLIALEVGFLGVMEHCSVRLSFPAAAKATEFVRGLCDESNPRKFDDFICNNKTFCKHIIREALMLLMSQIPAIGAIFNAYYSWWPKFELHVRMFMDRARAKFEEIRRLSDENFYVELENKCSHDSKWKGKVYRCYKLSAADYMLKWLFTYDRKLLKKNVAFPECLQVSPAKEQLMRMCIGFSCSPEILYDFEDLFKSDITNKTDTRNLSRTAKSSGMPNTVYKCIESNLSRDLTLLQLFGLTQNGINVLRALHGLYINFRGENEFQRLVDKLAPDEYALLTTYYILVVHLHCVRTFPIWSAEWYLSIAAQLRKRFELGNKEKIPETLRVLTVCPSCRSLCTQLGERRFHMRTKTQARKTSVKANLLRRRKKTVMVNCSNVFEDISVGNGYYVCARIGKPTTRKRRGLGRRQNTTDLQSTASTDYVRASACGKMPVETIYAGGRVVVFNGKFTEKRELSEYTKQPIIQLPCCAKWSRYVHSNWGPVYQCKTCQKELDDEESIFRCVCCLGPRPESQMTKFTVFDDNITFSVQEVMICARCLNVIDRDSFSQMPMLSGIPLRYQAVIEKRYTRKRKRL
jgi:hypothetical protein